MAAGCSGIPCANLKGKCIKRINYYSPKFPSIWKNWMEQMSSNSLLNSQKICAGFAKEITEQWGQTEFVSPKLIKLEANVNLKGKCIKRINYYSPKFPSIWKNWMEQMSSNSLLNSQKICAGFAKEITEQWGQTEFVSPKLIKLEANVNIKTPYFLFAFYLTQNEWVRKNAYK